MSTSEDIRWKQRLNSFEKALGQLSRFINKRILNELEQQGLIKAFEYTYELSWNTMKDYLEYQGIGNLIGSRDVIREAFSNNLIEDGEGWMDMLKSRNLTSHSYNQETANEIGHAVTSKYYDLFLILEEKFNSL